MNPLSLSYYTVPELTPPEAVRVAAGAGCAHVGMRLLAGQPGRDLAPIMEDPALRRETLACLRDTGVTVLDANTARVTPETDMEAFRPFLEVAAGLGARHVLATGDDPEEGRLAERLAWLCDEAAGFGLDVQFEFVPWMSVPDILSAARLIRAVGRDNLGIAIDALHFDRSGGRPADIAEVPADRLAYLHLCDAPGDWSHGKDDMLHVAVRERLFPGEGAIDLVGLLRAVPRGIPLALEIPTETLARSMDAQARVRRAVEATGRVLSAAYDPADRES